MNKSLLLSEIRIDGGTQMRVEIDQEYVEELADVLRGGGKLPNAVVFHDGAHYWLGGGFHRYIGHEKAGIPAMPCEVRVGTQRDAIIFAAGDNSDHGLRRSNEDKRKAVTALLTDEQWSQASNRWVAEQCKVGDQLVATVREEIEAGARSRTSDNNGSTNGQTRTDRRGRQQPAKKPKPGRKLCPACTRKGVRANCPDCRDLNRKEGKPNKKAGTATDPSGEKDCFGNEVPKRCRDALFDPWIQDTFDMLAAMNDKILAARIPDSIEKRKKRYPFFDAKDIADGAIFVQQYLDKLLDHVKENRPAAVCPMCQGKGCSDCRSSGLVSRNLYQQLKDKLKC